MGSHGPRTGKTRRWKPRDIHGLRVADALLRPCLMTGIGQDLRFTLRTLMKSKVFTLVAVVALALGIGGTTVMYAAVHGVLGSSLPYPEADRLVRLWESWQPDGSGSVAD